MYQHILIFTCTILFSHYGLKYILDEKTKAPPQIKYYLLHFLTNMYIVSIIYKNVITVLLNPLSYIKIFPYSSTIITIFHMYHILFYKNISIDEKIHHFVNVFILYPFFFLIDHTMILELGTFFLMGLPGGLTYLLLFLKHFNIVDKITEKRISKHLNLWIRAPGIILTIVIMYINMYYNYKNLTTIYIFAHIIIMISIYWNAMYFTNTIVTSYVKLNYKYELIKKIKQSSLDTDIQNEVLEFIK